MNTRRKLYIALTAAASLSTMLTSIAAAAMSGNGVFGG